MHEGPAGKCVTARKHLPLCLLSACLGTMRPFSQDALKSSMDLWIDTFPHVASERLTWLTLAAGGQKTLRCVFVCEVYLFAVTVFFLLQLCRSFVLLAIDRP